MGVTPHNVALVNLTNKAFCQSDNPAPIGLGGTQPVGYVFQWVPGNNIDNQQAFSPIFDPGVVPNGLPDGSALGKINYTFTALRLSDGCIFESTMTVSDSTLAFASAGNDKIGDGCTLGVRADVGAVETTGDYFQWRAVNTDFAAGLTALKAHARFGNDVIGQQIGTNKFLYARFPLCSDNGNIGYWIDYELKASYFPFNNNCFTRDTVRVFVPCCTPGISCPIPTASIKGTDGGCSSPQTRLSVSKLDGATYVWRTYSIDGVIQAPNTPPNGLFISNNGVKGTAISAAGPHPNEVIVDFDDPTWGWVGKNVIVYEVTQTIDYGFGPVSCFARQQVFSGINATPVIGVNDLSLCVVNAPAIRLGTTGKNAPYTLDGSNFTQAPNSAFEWSWTAVGGTPPPTITGGGTTAFPTLNPDKIGIYQVKVRNPLTGCLAVDTLIVYIKPLSINAGTDFATICPGTLIQLGTPAVPSNTYSWSPSAGLNFPAGTPNSTVAQPYLLVPNTPAPPTTLTYTLTVTDTETGCQATDDLTIGTTTTPPPAITPTSYAACPGSKFKIGPAYYYAPGATYTWTAVSGGADIAWLSSPTIPEPIITVPSGFTGPAIFKLTVVKGTCGTVNADFTITNSNPTMSLTGGVADCATGIAIGETGLAGYAYFWSPSDGLYNYNNLTSNNVYKGGSQAIVYARPTYTTVYTVTRINNITGCLQTATVNVDPPTGAAVNAGNDQSYCLGSGPKTLGLSGSGTLAWSAIGYTADANGTTPTAIASPMTSAIMLGYIGGGGSSATVSFPIGTPSPGKYVYRITSTNGACSISDDVEVVVANTPSGVAGASKNICPGQSIQLGAITNPGTLTYNWTALNPSSEGSTIGDATALRPYVKPIVNTTYQVVFTDATTGCSGKEQVSVVVNPKPNVPDVSMPVTCAPATAIDLTAQASGYGSLVNPVWYKNLYPGGTVVSTPTSVTPTGVTDYYLLSQNSFGCPDTAKITVNISNPQTPNILSSANLNCPTSSINLATYQGTPSKVGNTLEWHNANNTDAASLLSSTTVSTSNTYYLFEKAPSPANCYSASDNIVVSFKSPPTGTFTQNVCNNNGTTATTTDDYFTVTVSGVTSTSAGASGKYEVVLNGIVLNTGGTAYGTSVTVGTTTTFKSDGTTTYSLTIRDLDQLSCVTPVFTTTASAACSVIPCPTPTCIPVIVTRNN